MNSAPPRITNRGSEDENIAGVIEKEKGGARHIARRMRELQDKQDRASGRTKSRARAPMSQEETQRVAIMEEEEAQGAK